MKIAANLFLMVLLCLVIWKETGSISIPIFFFITWAWIARVWQDVKNNEKLMARTHRNMWEIMGKGDPNGES